MEPNLQIAVKEMKEGQDYQVIAFHGEFDKAGHTAVRSELTDTVKNFKGKTVVFDFSDLKFINSEGIGYLMEIHTHMTKEEQSLVVVGLKAHIADVFETIGISDVIPVFKNVDAFLNQ